MYSKVEVLCFLFYSPGVAVNAFPSVVGKFLTTGSVSALSIVIIPSKNKNNDLRTQVND